MNNHQDLLKTSTSQLSLLARNNQIAKNSRSSVEKFGQTGYSHLDHHDQMKKFEGQPKMVHQLVSRPKSRQNTLQSNAHLYGSQDKTRFSVLSGNSYQKNSQLGMQSALNLPTGSFDNINDINLSPKTRVIPKNSTMTLMKLQNKLNQSGEHLNQPHIIQQIGVPSKKTQVFRNEGRYLASSHQSNLNLSNNNLKMQRKNKMTQHQLICQKFGGFNTATKHNQLKQLIQSQHAKLPTKMMTTFENDKNSAKGSPSSFKKAAAQHTGSGRYMPLEPTDTAKNKYTQAKLSRSSAEYLKYYNRMQQMEQNIANDASNSEAMQGSKKSSTSIFGQNRLQNAKSIGLLDLRKQLDKNAKRMLNPNSKQQQQSYVTGQDYEVDAMLTNQHIQTGFKIARGGEHCHNKKLDSTQGSS